MNDAQEQWDQVEQAQREAVAYRLVSSLRGHFKWAEDAGALGLAELEARNRKMVDAYCLALRLLGVDAPVLTGDPESR